MIRDRTRPVLAVSLLLAVVGVLGTYARLRGASTSSNAPKNVTVTGPTLAPVSAGASHLPAPEESVPRLPLSKPSKRESIARPAQPTVSLASTRASKAHADSFIYSGDRRSNRNARGAAKHLDSVATDFDSSKSLLPSRPASLPKAQSSSSLPNPPTSNSPADGAAEVSTSPSLNVSVTDPNSQNLTVNFYGKVIPSITPGPNFSIVALPDTQYYSAGLEGGTLAMFNSQTQWIVNNRIGQNIAFVIGLGDLVQDGNNGGNYSEWINANSAVSILDDPIATGLPQGIPYSFGVGNHDQGPAGDGSPDDTAGYNQYFGFSRYSGKSYYGGHYGTDNDNHYELFSAGGMDFIVINMAFDDPQYNGPELTSILAWANGLLQTYSSRRAIVATHYLINSGFNASWSNQGLATYNALQGNPNLFLMLCGHVNPPEGQRADVYNGNRVYTFLSDYQETGYGGDGWLRILTFSPTTNQIQVQTYSPYIEQYETTSSGNFTINYDMQGSGNNFTLLASNAGVLSGSSTGYTWPSLAPGSKYEWYVTVSNSSGTTVGPLWSFATTGNSPVTLSPSSLSFPSQLVNASSASQAVTLSNTGNAALTVTGIAATTQYAQTNNCPISPSTLAVNGTCTIDVSFTPTAAGTQSASLTISDSAAGSPQQVSLTGTGSSPAPLISLSSGSLTFGTQVLNTSSTAQAVMLTNVGTASLGITSIVASGDYAQANSCGTSVANAANCSISVIFTPTAIGTRTGAITITDNAAGSPHIISLTGSGSASLAPAVTLSSSSLTFADPPVTVVQDASTTGGGSTTLAVAFAGNVTQNNLMVVGVSSYAGNTFSSPAITDTLGSNWSLAVAENPGTTGTPSQSNIYYAVVPSTGPNTVTVHTTGTNNLHLHIYEIAGLMTSSVLDQTGANFQSNATAATVSTSGPTTAGNEYVYAYIGRDNGVGTWTAGNGYRDAVSSPNTGSTTDAFSEDQFISVTGTQTATATSSAADGLTSVIATFRASGGGTRVGATSAAQTVKLNNTGTGSLTTTSIVASGNYAQTNTCASPVAAGSSCTINVTFTPTVIGTQTGSITIGDNASTSPQIINLTGTGLSGPAVTGLSPNSAAAGTSVTITGTNFGATQGASTVRFNGTPATPTAWSATSITVPVPTGATTGNVVVTVSGAASNGVTFTVLKAIAVVQHKSVSATGGASLALAFPSNVTSGDLIVVAVSTYSGAAITSPTDNSSPSNNTYALAVSDQPPTTGTPSAASIYYAVANATGPLTITAHINAAHNIHLHIYEISGLSSTISSILDQTGANFQTSTTSATVSTGGATTVANEYVFAFFATDNSTQTWTQGGAYTDVETSNRVGGDSGFSADLVSSSMGKQTATATLTSADLVTSLLATFKHQ